MNRRYYVDMDGVLVKYDRDAYRGPDPIWLRKNEHYFRNLEPDREFLELMDHLYQHSRYTGDEIYVLTTLPINGAIFNEHFHDKIAWCHEWLPYIDIDHILISVTSKRDAVEYIHNKEITTQDILIDDYNKNLNSWCDAGGTAIKYCNGLNDPMSFDGEKIYKHSPLDDKLKSIEMAMDPLYGID
ncbi:hypothetical protein J6A31_06040 [bacterium]|nr:hypothetical protein [bacterium]